MNNSLKNIIDLSKLDQQNALHEENKETTKTNLNALIARKNDLLKTIQSINEKTENSNTSINKNGIYLQELDAKLSDISEKTKKIKTEKEAKALSLEEDIAKEQITFANDEIKRFEGIVQDSEGKIKEEEEKLNTLEEEIKEEEEKVAKEIKSIERSAKKIKKEKDELVKNIDEKAILFYNKIRQWAQNTSVVPVIEQVCYGCYIKLNDQAYIDILRQEEITTCPHCGRILYKEEKVSQSAS